MGIWGGRILNLWVTPSFAIQKPFLLLKWLLFAFMREVFICFLCAMLLYSYYKKVLYYFVIYYHYINICALYVRYIILELN